jgi:cell division protein FtsN
MVRKASGKYYVVLGSFGKTDNAYSFYNNLRAQGISTAKIVAPGGENDKYRVCYGVFDTKADAIRQGKMYGKRKAVEFLVMTY